MQDVHVKLNPGLIWQKQRSKGRRLFSPANWTFKVETSEVLRLEHGFVRFWNFNTSKSRAKLPGKFWTVVLEKDGDEMERSYEKWGSITQSQGGEEYPV